MIHFNGWTPIVKKIGIWGGTIVVSAGILSWVYANGFVKPTADRARDSVVVVVERGHREIRDLVRGEGKIRDNADSLLWNAINDLAANIRGNTYTKDQIDAMWLHHRREQDSTFRALMRARSR